MTHRLSLELLGQAFRFIDCIDPARNDDGVVKEYMPQGRYQNSHSLSLNAHGGGPFCRFSLKGAPSAQGVYVVTVDGAVVYVGRCDDLAERFGPRGYGLISPRNCFVRGQSTNCKVNRLVLQAAKADQPIEVWFHHTETPAEVEIAMIEALRPRWNGRYRET